MADPVVSVVIETIRDMLLEEFVFGVRDKVVELQAELEALESFMNDANAKKHQEERVRTCVLQAKWLAYRAEDIIEEYAIKVASKRGWGFTRAASIVGEGISIYKVGNEIRNLKTKIVDLIKKLEGYGINRIIEAPPSPATIEKQRKLRTTYAHEVDEYFVGMEDDVSKIVTWVTEDDKIRHVISICGIGGLGKTTIARKVFNHHQVQGSFKYFAWVSVSEQCQIKILLKSILIQILGDKGQDNIKDMEEDTMVRKLYDVLQNEKCFVVLDDMWEINDWARLSKVFPILEGSSKILITTRTREVSKVADTQHEPTLLEEKDGWDLLTKIAFDQKEDRVNKLPENVESIGRDMLRKCGGLPLAIVAIGGVLRNKDPLIEWEAVNRKFGIYMRENDGILTVLAFSYDNLPSYLRPCFLYMGCFREDEQIDVMHLYQLWMAEGLIPSNKQGPGESLMDAASNVLDELISRHMVQPQIRNILTDKKSCRLHDLVRELCLTKGQEEEFLEFESKQFIKNDETWVIRYDGLDSCRKSTWVIRYDGLDLGRKSIVIDNKYRRWVSIEISGHNTYIRALVVIKSPKRFITLDNHVFKFSGPRSNFTSLRSLVLDGCKFKNNKLPKEIRYMIHLRYLSLQHTLNGGKLPAFIGDLQYLQTLNIANNLGLQLPNIFHKMKRLRCLYVTQYRLPSMSARRLEFHGLSELEVVEGLDSKCDIFTHLSEFVNLRRFSARIFGYENLCAILVQLSSLLKVQYISIKFQIADSRSQLEKSLIDVKKLLLCRHLHDLVLWAPIGKFPRYEPQFWPHLVSLELWKTKFEEDPMPFLQELPNLRKLKLCRKAYVGKDMYCSSKAFPKLTSLEISHLFNIEIWRVDAGAFPNLSTLEIHYLTSIEIWRVDAGAFPNLSSLNICGCNSVEIVPHGLTSITSLTRIDIKYMPEEFSIKYGRLQNTNH